MHACTHARVCTHAHTHSHACTHARTHTYTQMHMWCACIPNPHIWTHAHIHTHTYTRICVYLCLGHHGNTPKSTTDVVRPSLHPAHAQHQVRQRYGHCHQRPVRCAWWLCRSAWPEEERGVQRKVWHQGWNGAAFWACKSESYLFVCVPFVTLTCFTFLSCPTYLYSPSHSLNSHQFSDDGWWGGGPWWRNPFNTSDLTSGTLFLCQASLFTLLF